MPLYQQVADRLRRRITAGEIRPGHAVPSEHEITVEFEVSRITATKALRMLRADGLVYAVRGEGTFVGPEDAPRAPNATAKHRVIAAEIVERIRAGELRPNLPIPSEKQLMQQHDAAKVTVRNAVAFLREQGWVFTVPARGSYVSPKKDWPKT